MEELMNIESWKDAGAQMGVIVGGTLLAHGATQLFLKSGGLLKLEKPLLPDKWYTKAAAAGLSIVGGIYAKNNLVKLLMFGAAGYFTLSMANNIIDSEDITPESVRTALRPFIPALGSTEMNDGFDAKFYQRAIQMRDAGAPAPGLPMPSMAMDTNENLLGVENRVNYNAA